MYEIIGLVALLFPSSVQWSRGGVTFGPPWWWKLGEYAVGIVMSPKPPEVSQVTAPLDTATTAGK